MSAARLSCALTLAAALLGGCAALLVPGTGALPEAPLLRLAPAALGRSLSQQQLLTVHAPGRAPQRADLLLEVDAQAVRMALLGLGQTGARIEWDGHELRQQRAPWWPAAVPAERILSELQFSLWPAQAVRDALPAGWSVDDAATLRRLSWHGQSVLTVRRDGARRVELVNERDGYRLVIESHDLQESLP